MNPYEVLGVKEDCNIKDIKDSYRSLSREYHPDVNNGESDIFIKINLAYRVLSDPEKRRLYDEQGIIVDEEKNHIENIVNSRMADISNAWIDNMIRGHKIPLKKFVSDRLDDGINKINSVNRDIKNNIIRLEKIEKKLVFSSNDSIIHRMIKQRLESYKKGIHQNENELIVVSKLQKIIANYEYEEDEMEYFAPIKYINITTSTTGT